MNEQTKTFIDTVEKKLENELEKLVAFVAEGHATVDGLKKKIKNWSIYLSSPDISELYNVSEIVEKLQRDLAVSQAKLSNDEQNLALLTQVGRN
jgi:hypothetical protein